MKNENAATDNFTLTKEEVLRFPTWQIFDLQYSKYNVLPEKIKGYNDKLKASGERKGKLRKGEEDVMGFLMHLTIKQLNHTRKEYPSKYLMYLSSNFDTFPVMCNRATIRAALNHEYCLGTVYNQINRLLDAELILQKENTSRVRQELLGEDGRKTVIVKMMENGRGDFVLYLPKELFIKRFYFVSDMENRRNDAPAAQFLQTVEQALDSNQIQILEQSLSDSIEALKINTNPCWGTGKKSGEAEPLNENDRLRREGRYRGDDAKYPIEKNVAPGGSETGEKMAENVENLPVKPELEGKKETVVSPEFLEGRKRAVVDAGILKLVASMQEDGLKIKHLQAKNEKADAYRKIHEKDHRIAKEMPSKELDFLATLLFYMAVRLIFPHYTPEYRKEIAPQAIAQLKILIQHTCSRFKAFNDAKFGFLIVSRAIYLAFRHLHKKQNAYTYHINTWLRTDDEYKSGTLKTVIDNWIPREQERLNAYADKRSALAKWQIAQNRANDLFLDVIWTLHKGYSTTKTAFAEARKKLDNICRKCELTEKQSEKIRKDFETKTYGIMAELDRIGEHEPDALWAAFERWRKQSKAS